MKRVLGVMIWGAASLALFAARSQAQSGYILTNYETARIVWEYGPISPYNAPERAIVQCTVGSDSFEATVPYPTTELHVVAVVPQPLSADYVCVVLAENRAGRSAPSTPLRFLVLQAPTAPGHLRLVP